MTSWAGITTMIGCWLWLSTVTPFAAATELVREEPISIGTILANPQAFNMRAVRLQGIIKTLQVIQAGGGGCRGQGIHDAYVFILNDHTGELQIFDRGTCQGAGTFLAVKPQMTEFFAGDSVEVVIDVSLVHSPNFESSSLEGALRWVKRIPPPSEDASGTSP